MIENPFFSLHLWPYRKGIWQCEIQSNGLVFDAYATCLGAVLSGALLKCCEAYEINYQKLSFLEALEQCAIESELRAGKWVSKTAEA